MNPNFSEAYYNRASSLYVLGEYGEALLNLEKALELSPNDFQTLHNIGATLRKLGKLDEAIKYFDMALDANPNDIKTYRSKGKLLIEIGKVTEAKIIFDKIRVTNQGWGISIYNMSNYSVYVLVNTNGKRQSRIMN